MTTFVYCLISWILGFMVACVILFTPTEEQVAHCPKLPEDIFTVRTFETTYCTDENRKTVIERIVESTRTEIVPTN